MFEIFQARGAELLTPPTFGQSTPHPILNILKVKYQNVQAVLILEHMVDTLAYHICKECFVNSITTYELEFFQVIFDLSVILSV